MHTRNRNHGTVLVLSLLFLVILSTLTVAMASFSGNCVQIADNQRQGDVAYRAAESGLEVMRYWLSRFVMPKTTPPNQYLATIVASLRSDLTAAGVSQIVVQDDGAIRTVALDPSVGSSFSAHLRMDANDPTILHLAAYVKAGDVYVSADSGPLHLANYLGVPCLGLFGPKDPALYRPYFPPSRAVRREVDCRPCPRRRARKWRCSGAPTLWPFLNSPACRIPGPARSG